MKLKKTITLLGICLAISQITQLFNNIPAYASAISFNQSNNITFYIDNQIESSHIESIRLVSGYMDHPTLKNLLNGNTVTIPEGQYVLSITLKDGYEFKTSDGYYRIYPQSNPDATYRDTFSIFQSGNIRTDLYIDSDCRNQTLIIAGETGINYRHNREISESRFYEWFPEYKGKEFSYTIWNGTSFEDHSYEITKNGKPLLPNDKLKVGDKLKITMHSYDDNIFFTQVCFENTPLVLNDSGEWSSEYTITTDDIPAAYNKKPEDCVIRLSTWAPFWDFGRSDMQVNINSQSASGGNFDVYKVNLDKNNNETLSKITNNTRILPGNRLKLVPNPTSGWEFKEWNVSGGVVTKNNYFVITCEDVTISAIFNKQQQTASPIPPTQSVIITDPHLELALAEAKNKLATAEKNLKYARTRLENAQKRTQWVFSNGDFKQVADEEAIRDAEYLVSITELAYQKVKLEYDELLAQINSSSPVSYADINNDGRTDVTDAIMLIDLVLNGKTNVSKHDFNNDGSVNIIDVTALIDRILEI